MDPNTNGAGVGHSRVAAAVLGLSLLGLVLAAQPIGSSPRARPVSGRGAPCQVVLVATGSYRAEVRTGGPVPVVEFLSASGPRFERISNRGGYPACDQPIGTLSPPVKSRNASVLLFQIANELHAAAAVEFRSSQRPHIEYAYRDFGNLAMAIRADIGWAGFREILADVAGQLIRRYANPTALLTDAGAKWVADQALKVILQEYVAGRDPGLIVDGLLADMVKHLQGKAQLLARTLGGPALEQALKPHLTQIANDVKALILEQHPDVQSVRIDVSDETTDCQHSLDLAWHFKGGQYRAVLTIRCGPSQPDHVASVVINAPTLKPGEAGMVTVSALNQLGSAFPLSAATITGLGAVMPDGSSEPAAAITGTTATFAFTAAQPRGDGAYPLSVRIVTDRSTGLLTGLNTAVVTVLNVAPVLQSVTPSGAEADPGEMLELGQARVHVIDDNADARHANEVAARSLTIAHPGGLETTPLFDNADGARQVSFDAGSGSYVFEFSRNGKVAEPHAHGSWPATVSIVDDNGQVATGAVNLDVNDVAPTVTTSTVTPQFVHRGDARRINVTARFGDRNGVDDIAAADIDATAAGGGTYTLLNGLTELGRGEDWIEVQIAAPFGHTDAVGQHPIAVAVRDEAAEGRLADFLSVGNVAPETFGHGYITGFDPATEAASLATFTPAKGVCPNQPFRAGVIAGDPEGDALSVIGTIVETGAQGTFRNSSGRIWIVDMRAPGTPGPYTIRIDVSEIPPDKAAVVTMPLEVVPCEAVDDEQRLAIADPVTPGDVALAPRDESSQLLLGSFAGTRVRPADPSESGPGSGPSVRALEDSLGMAFAALDGTAGPGALPVETYLVATGGSTGPVVQFFGVNRSGVAVAMPSGPLVFEPVRIDRAAQERIGSLLQRLVAAGGQPTVLNAYCLELLRKPPAAGTVMRVASAPVQQSFTSLQRLFGASDRLASLNALRPDSDAGEYLHAIRQWSIWTHVERFDLPGFEREFVRVTRENFAEAGDAWTAQVEQAVRGLVPNRWNDIQQVLRETERGAPAPNDR